MARDQVSPGSTVSVEHDTPKRSPWDMEPSPEAAQPGSKPDYAGPGELISHPSMVSPWEVARSFSSRETPSPSGGPHPRSQL